MPVRYRHYYLHKISETVEKQNEAIEKQKEMISGNKKPEGPIGPPVLPNNKTEKLPPSDFVTKAGKAKSPKK